MWVKICGNTRLEDCLLEAELGADAVGFVFAPGKRTVSAQRVAAITQRLPPTLETLGVFTTTDADVIIQSAEEARLTGVQLHSEYAPGLSERLRRHFAHHPVRILQVLQWNVDARSHEQVDALARLLREVQKDGFVDAILLDACTSQQSGGTGRVFDWHSAQPLLQASEVPVIVAGGLTPLNVADAAVSLAPAGVDVSSGVESSPGVKDAEKVRAFLAAARSRSD